MKKRNNRFYPKPWDQHCKEEAKLLSVEKRQEFINYIFNESLTLGEAAEKADLNFDEASGIMMMQIKELKYIASKCE